MPSGSERVDVPRRVRSLLGRGAGTTAATDGIEHPRVGADPYPDATRHSDVVTTVRVTLARRRGTIHGPRPSELMTPDVTNATRERRGQP